MLLTSLLIVGANAHAQGTGFTYQGRLNDGTNPANGSFDLSFTLFDAAETGIQQGGSLTHAATVVNNGLFIVTLDFGNQFPGANRWLEIAVRTNGGGGFVTLNPRQALTPTPYAILAGKANVVGPNQTFTGVNSFSGNVSLVGATNSIIFPATSGANAPMIHMFASGTLNADRMVIAHSPTFANWGLQYQDTVDRFNFLASGVPVMSINLAGQSVGIGTVSPVSALQVVGTVTASSFAGDGSGLTGLGFWKTSGNAGANPADGAFLGTTDYLPLDLKVNGVRGLRLEPTPFIDAVNVIGGSPYNQVLNGALSATIGGGGGLIVGSNTVAGDFGTVSGGRGNAANNAEATVAGGRANTASGGNSVVSGGYGNTASGAKAVVPGGEGNLAAGSYSLAAGNRAKASHDGALVWADSQNLDFLSTTVNQFSVRAAGGARFVTAGAGMTLDGQPVLTGPGVVGTSSSLGVAGVSAVGAGSSGTALQVSTGGIKVTGAGINTGTAVFVQRATAANIEAGATHRTTITNPLCDGDPDAILIITHNYNPSLTGNILDTNPTSVYYNSSLAKWQIYHDNFVAMTVNNAYNVLIIKP